MDTGVVFIGAGNLATSVATNLYEAGIAINQVIATTLNSAKTLAGRVGATYSDRIEQLMPNAAMYIIAVPDSKIESVLKSLCPLKQMVVHTSGSTPISVFDENKFPVHGILYPFQTFTKSRIVSLQNVPICIEANNTSSLSQLSNFAQQLSCRVLQMDSEQRKWLHLTGVFGCNFINHILTITHSIASSNGIDFEILKPLVEETIQKAFDGNPADMQTGPAIRGDFNTMNKHQQMLMELDPALQKIYNVLSLEIQNWGKTQQHKPD